jgi:hypothetical protein
MVSSVAKHFPKSDKTQKGHMKQIKQGTCSTKLKADRSPLVAQPGIKHRDAYLFVFDTTKKNMYTNQTSHFPITS